MYKNEDGGIVLNPGSMTFPKGSLKKSFIIMDDEDIKLYEFDYNNDGIEVLNTFSFVKKEYIY
jgi:predicted phosphodiesterase